jgi:FkbM family methyltransferase
VNLVRLWLTRVVSAYVRHVPAHRGHWRLALLAVKLSPALKHGRPRTVRVHEGFRLIVDGTSQTGRIAYATGDYEPRTTRIMRALIKAGDTVVDVGANIGYFTIVGARATGPAGHVEAFEPVPEIRRALGANLQLNAITNVTVHDQALSDRTGTTHFYLAPQEDSGLGSLRQLDNGVTIDVQQVSFDDWWQQRSRVAVIKIDVEGGELLVLRGMKQCLQRDRPDILLEVTDSYLHGLGTSADELIELLLAADYRVYEVPDAGPLVRLNGPADLLRCPSQFNALCTQRDIETMAL